ncbi:unnamed protein product [Meloidogyne enterolobii]|uniref:Uncharacterized protein n=1 Tax=Meloidogyne enterolobii TaxID=390850 RepID=A0ACB1ASW4_MELEN
MPFSKNHISAPERDIFKRFCDTYSQKYALSNGFVRFFPKIFSEAVGFGISGRSGLSRPIFNFMKNAETCQLRYK